MSKLIELDKIKSNFIPYCAACGRPITKYNDSGWEAFVGDGITTQPQCKDCESIADLNTTKLLTTSDSQLQ